MGTDIFFVQIAGKVNASLSLFSRAMGLYIIKLNWKNLFVFFFITASTEISYQVDI